MNSKEFKNIFNDFTTRNGFESAFGGWLKESAECIVVLDLQKSNFGDYYELNIKIFIQGMFGNCYTKNKNLVKKSVGDIFTRQPNYYNDIFDFDISISDDSRIDKLELFFSDFIIPFTDKSLSLSGLKVLAEQEKILVFDAIKKELGW
ncbi:MAG: DUF4304 domain-containing protein [Phycisphaerales bacterium]|nr:DUF4304 domain-containing protein [Phycisphaerales bacterium]